MLLFCLKLSTLISYLFQFLALNCFGVDLTKVEKKIIIDIVLTFFYYTKLLKYNFIYEGQVSVTLRIIMQHYQNS